MSRTGSEKTRQRILDVATNLFAQKGFDSTGMRDIATSAKLALGTAYTYFESKQEILFTLFEQQNVELTDLIKSRISNNDTVNERILNFCQLTLEFFLQDRRQAYLMYMVVPLRELAQSPIYRDAEYLRILTDLLKEGQSAGLVRDDVDVLIMANSVIGILVRLIGLWLSSNGRWDMETNSNAILKLILSTIEPRQNPTGKISNEK